MCVPVCAFVRFTFPAFALAVGTTMTTHWHLIGSRKKVSEKVRKKMDLGTYALIFTKPLTHSNNDKRNFLVNIFISNMDKIIIVHS